ncbi:MAG: DUF6457 domain-containing protein, partial [Rhodoglobus sp.]|nr:DUF6457 domain-containing protein [Rhodoglobus sp.]
ELLSEWNSRLSDALGVPPADVDLILDLAGKAAHSIVRPAAPLTTFLVGYAAAMRSQNGLASAEALAEAVAVAVKLAAPDAR